MSLVKLLAASGVSVPLTKIGKLNVNLLLLVSHCNAALMVGVPRLNVTDSFSVSLDTLSELIRKSFAVVPEIDTDEALKFVIEALST